MSDVDGRSARAERTRSLIVDAHLGLICGGELKPTARQVTERAGVSPRTLWGHFTDMEAVMAASARRQLDGQDTGYSAPPTGANFSERVGAYARHRANALEDLTPLARAADVQRPFSPVLQQNLRQNLEGIRREIEAHFAEELDQHDSGARERRVMALVVASDWASWQLLRHYLERSVAEAIAVLETSVAALLVGPAPPVSDSTKGNPA